MFSSFFIWCHANFTCHRTKVWPQDFSIQFYFVKYFMHKVPNKCCPVKGVWLSFKYVILLLLGALRPSEIYSLCLMTWKHVKVISFSHLAHYDSSFLSFPPELKFSRDRCPIPRAADTGSVYCSPIWAKGSGPEWFWELATARSPCRYDLQPSGLSDALHPPLNSWEEQRPGWQQNVAQGDSAMSQPWQNAKKQTMKDVFEENGWLCGCLGGSVVSKLTSYQEYLISTLLTFCTSLHEPVWVSCCFLPQF